MLIVCWLLPLLVRIEAATFDVDMTSHSQEITKTTTTIHGTTI